MLRRGAASSILALVLLTAPAGARAGARCSFPHTRTISSDSAGRLFSTRARDGKALYGVCLYATGVPRLLFYNTSDESGPTRPQIYLFGPLRMRGPYVLVAGEIPRSNEPDQGIVRVFDARQGTPGSVDSPIRFHGDALVVHEIDPLLGGGGEGSSFPDGVVQSDGAAAWVQAPGFDANCDPYSLVGPLYYPSDRLVCAIGAHATTPQTLDSGPNIGGSLTLQGTTLSWQDSGRTRTASLP